LPRLRRSLRNARPAVDPVLRGLIGNDEGRPQRPAVGSGRDEASLSHYPRDAFTVPQQLALDRGMLGVMPVAVGCRKLSQVARGRPGAWLGVFSGPVDPVASRSGHGLE